MYKLKVYSPSVNERKTFTVKYILKNVCVKHNDVGELYYNFIGGEWSTIKKLEIHVYLPDNKGQIYFWGHGPDNGTSKKVDNTHIKFEVNNVASGKYVATRLVFDNSNIKYAIKTSKINAYDLIFKDEQQIAKVSDAKSSYTRYIYIFALILLAYWIVLLIVYEKDKKYTTVHVNEEELFEKYNPMLAGCIQGSREILARDIIAVVLNLIDKKYINLEILNADVTEKENYNYIIKKVPETEEKMDIIEKYVYDWVFDGQASTELSDALKNMANSGEANEKFTQLNRLVQNKLNNKGANTQSVPHGLRVINTILFFVVLVIAFIHIHIEGFEIYSSMDILLTVFYISVAFLPIVLWLIYIPIYILMKVRHRVTSLLHKITGQKVITTSVAIIAIFLIILIITILFSNVGNRYIIADEILICAAMLIMFTDNLMLKNNVNMIEDYSRLNGLKEKIENYTMMEDRDIEQVVLWEKYLAYAVSFGIANKISKRIKQLNIDEDLLSIVDNAKMMDYIRSDYYYFYTNSSLDRRYMRRFRTFSSSVTKSYAKSAMSRGGSSGRGGGFTGGGGFHGGGGRGGGRRSILKKTNIKR